MKFKLSEIMDVIGGGTPKTTKPEYWNGNIPWLSVKDFNNDYRYVYKTEKTITQLGLENSSTKLLQKGDVIISARGTVGEIATIPFQMAFNQSCYGLRAKTDKVISDYLYYLVKHNIFVLKKNTHGSVFDTITRDTFDSIEVQIPSLETQEKVASILSDLDKKIELNSAINDNLEQQAQLLFNEFFFERKQIPNTWKKGCLLDIADYLNGLAMQKFRPLENETGIPVLKIKELRQGICDNNSERCSSNIKNDFIINDGDVIFSWSGSLLVDFWCGGICGLNQHLFKVSSDKYDKWFYYSWTKHHLKKFISLASDMATTMGHIKREELEKAEVLIPDKDDYNKIGTVLKPIYESIISNRIENGRLSVLRDSLLPKLISGEIDVSNTEI